MYHYCTIDEDIEVMYKQVNETGNILVHIEIPDAKYCFRQMDCIVPTYEVTNVVGMTEEEIDKYVNFCKSNAYLLLENKVLD